MTCLATGAPRLQVYWKKNNNTLHNDSSVTVGYVTTSRHRCQNLNYSFTFYSALLCTARTMLSHDVCLSVRPSVTRRYCVETAKHVIQLSTPLSFSYQTLWHYSDGDRPKRDVECRGYGKIAIFNDQYLASYYLGNDTRQGHSYYGTPIGTRMRSIEIEWCYFQ